MGSGSLGGGVSSGSPVGEGSGSPMGLAGSDPCAGMRGMSDPYVFRGFNQAPVGYNSAAGYAPAKPYMLADASPTATGGEPCGI